MAAKISPNELLVFDTSFAIALCVPSDENHQRAIALGKQIVERKARLLTTRAIFFEIGNSLAKQRYRKTAIDLMGELESDSNVEILPLTEDLYEEAYSLFVARDDKEWGSSIASPSK